MKNLEIKIKIALEKFQRLKDQLRDSYVQTLRQTDTYYHSDVGRLKLREETGQEPYLISYVRPNVASEKISDYHFYPVPDPEQFKKVTSGALREEVKVQKVRDLYRIDNARIHLDQVTELGNFLEIEILIRNDQDQAESGDFMTRLLDDMGLDRNATVDCGYRELMLKTRKESDTSTELISKPPVRDLEYYRTQNKVFWVVNRDINDQIRANQIVPAIFVEISDSEINILQFDLRIKMDNYKYTAWRSLLGQMYGIRVDVLLIAGDYLYDLNGNQVAFSSLGRSDVQVDSRHLAKFGLKIDSDDTSVGF